MTPTLAAANFRDSAWNASALLSSNFHLTQNENCHFTLCFQGRDDFHASKNGEPPSGSDRLLGDKRIERDVRRNHDRAMRRLRPLPEPLPQQLDSPARTRRRKAVKVKYLLLLSDNKVEAAADCQTATAGTIDHKAGDFTI